ncbi:GAF domain-containing protein [Marinitoga hydrogenitolerans DSM 16785]|uniref:GAF domain-containing protein n=1 Tax=Marinitoga hydrogenitolerans (strain DSM 16785 / JCM 12826 / AT1271) TaxID=1122195 RepID=A0A1M4WQG9_MARH1|nr:GAF domain-containing protein [Marinitoga hydrogenitolerans]SHE83475.1 GAF domain-containing protein [Marinitoga hydrogenitolerans DSM 16785]
MRSILQDLTPEFLKILNKDKIFWFDGWKEYKQTRPKIIREYEKLENLNENKVKERLNAIRRKDLDMFKQYWENNFLEIKKEMVMKLSRNAEYFQLKRGDFVVFIMGLLGLNSHYYIETYYGTVIVVDSFYHFLYKEDINKTIENSIINFIKNNPVNEKRALFGKVLSQIEKIIYDNNNINKVMEKIVKILYENIEYYNWVGFYLTDKNNKNMLKLGPYLGEPTEHINIPFGKGICGQAASTKNTFIVQDVTKESNYLSCSEKTKAEIVIPIIDKSGNVFGELDIDSHKLNPFTIEDTQFLEEIIDLFVKKFF